MNRPPGLARFYMVLAAADEITSPSENFLGLAHTLNLAQALMAPSDLLLLDEPTNHLDLEAILWQKVAEGVCGYFGFYCA